MSKELFEQQRQIEESNKPKYSINGIINYLRDLTESVEDGNDDPIVVLAKIGNVEKVMKECKDAVYLHALTEAEKYPEKTFTHKGVKVEKRAGRKVWNFKEIEEWQSIEKSRKEKENLYKAAYDAYTKGVEMVDEDGVKIPIPAVTNTKDVLVLKYAD